MLVYVVMYAVYHGADSGIVGVYKSLSDANQAMDEYNDSSIPDYYAVVEEHTIK